MRILQRLMQQKTLMGSSVVLVLWYGLHLIVQSSIIPSPYETMIAFARLIQGNLLIHIAVSLYRISLAMLIALIIGAPLGLWVGLNGKLDAVLSPVVYILYPIPKIAFLPVFMILLGLGDRSKILLIVTIIVFQIFLAARDGVKEISNELFFSVRSLGLNERQTYLNLVIPAVLPKIFSAVRISIGVSISVLFFSENFATTYGIGYFIMKSWIMVDYVDMFAGILTLSIMGTVLFKLIDWLEQRFCPWMFIQGRNVVGNVE